MKCPNPYRIELPKNSKYGVLYCTSRRQLKDYNTNLVFAQQRYEEATIPYYKKKWQSEVDKWNNKLDNFCPFGYDGIDYQYHLGCKFLYGNKKRFSEYFLREYKYSRIRFKTTYEFMDRLQNIFEDVADTYEQLFQSISKIDQIYENETKAKLEEQFAAKTTSGGDATTTGTTKNATLPDFPTDEKVMVYENQVGQSTTSKTGGSTLDTTFGTKLNNIVLNTSVSRGIIKDYMREYAKLFETIR